MMKHMLGATLIFLGLSHPVFAETIEFWIFDMSGKEYTPPIAKATLDTRSNEIAIIQQNGSNANVTAQVQDGKIIFRTNGTRVKSITIDKQAFITAATNRSQKYSDDYSGQRITSGMKRDNGRVAPVLYSGLGLNLAQKTGQAQRKSSAKPSFLPVIRTQRTESGGNKVKSHLRLVHPEDLSLIPLNWFDTMAIENSNGDRMPVRIIDLFVRDGVVRGRFVDLKTWYKIKAGGTTLSPDDLREAPLGDFTEVSEGRKEELLKRWKRYSKNKNYKRLGNPYFGPDQKSTFLRGGHLSKSLGQNHSTEFGTNQPAIGSGNQKTRPQIIELAKLVPTPNGHNLEETLQSQSSLAEYLAALKIFDKTRPRTKESDAKFDKAIKETFEKVLELGGEHRALKTTFDYVSNKENKLDLYESVLKRASTPLTYLGSIRDFQAVMTPKQIKELLIPAVLQSLPHLVNFSDFTPEHANALLHGMKLPFSKGQRAIVLESAIVKFTHIRPTDSTHPRINTRKQKPNPSALAQLRLIPYWKRTGRHQKYLRLVAAKHPTLPPLTETRLSQFTDEAGQFIGLVRDVCRKILRKTRN